MRYNLIHMKRLALLCIACFSASFAFGQGESKLLVQVQAESGEAIPFASIEVFRGDSLKYGTFTDSLGQGKIEEMVPGSYDLEVRYAGVVQERIQIGLNANEELRKTLTLSLANREYVTQTAHHPILPNLGSCSFWCKNERGEYLPISVELYCPGDDSMIASHSEIAGTITFKNLIEGEYQVCETINGHTSNSTIEVIGGVKTTSAIVAESVISRTVGCPRWSRWRSQFLSGPGTSFTLTAEDIRHLPY